MLDPMIGTRTCGLCNGTYESDTKLREHQRMAHRRRGNEERPQAVIVAEPSEETEDYVESLIFEFNIIGVQ
jgi:hypothetical protein